VEAAEKETNHKKRKSEAQKKKNLVLILIQLSRGMF
jgi:hypothetical protein